MPLADYPSNVKMYKGGKSQSFANVLIRVTETSNVCSIDQLLLAGWSLERPGEDGITKASNLGALK